MTEETYGRSTSGPAAWAGQGVDPTAVYEETHGAYAAPRDEGEMGGILQWSGALVSLALVAGMGVWGWQLATRDVSEVPVVLALEGPMRVAPDAPGGAAIPHQGLAVNAVQEARGATPVPDQLRVLDEPESLSDQDFVRVESAPPPVAAPVDAQDRAQQNLALVDRLVADIVNGDTPLDTVSRSPVNLPELSSVQAQETPAPDAVVVSGGLGRSLRPVQRPDRAAIPQPVLAAAPAAPAVEVTEGSRLVQLGAFDSVERAEAAWVRLASSAFAPLFDGKVQVVEEAASGGRTFYRLRAAGFSDLADARRFCAALKSGQADCIPVRAR